MSLTPLPPPLSPPHIILRWVSVADQLRAASVWPDIISGMPEPRAKSDGVKEDRRRPRNISSVSDNPVEIPDGCSMSTNTRINIIQYHDCQIKAKRRKDQMHQCLYPSSIMAAGHWFIQTTCLDDYQLSPKRFMIVSYITEIEHSTLGPLWKKSDFDRPLKSQVKPSEADTLLEF